ncbi:MAG: glycosyl hydrolase family 28-related protein, partial [Polyangia bacterium]
MTYRAIASFVLATALPLTVGLGCSSGTPTGSSGAGTGGSGAPSTGGSSGGGAGTTGGSATGGSNPTSAGGTPGTGGGAGGQLGPGGTAGAVSSGGHAGGAAGSVAGTGGAAPGGRAGGGGSGIASGGAGGGPPTSADCSSAGAVITFPPLPNAAKSPLYTVTANGTSQFVEKLTKFSAEMQVHYAYFGVATGCTATIAVTLSQTFSSYTVSPKSRKIAATKSGNTITFSSGPNYLILQFDSKELLFILIDEQEATPPQLGDANVKNIADYGVDDTGATLVTSKVQSAINAASGAAQNVLYFPAGRYKVGELSLKSNMTMYLAGGAMLDGSTSTSDYSVTGTPAVESTTHGLIHLYNVTNTKILGRGVI